MSAIDLVEIRAAVDRVLAGSKLTAPRITVSGAGPCRIEIDLRGVRDDAIARRACSAVSRMASRFAPGFYEIVVGWEAA